MRNTQACSILICFAPFNKASAKQFWLAESFGNIKLLKMSIESSTNSIMNIHSLRMHETSRASLNMGKFLLLSTSAFFVQIKTFLDFDQLNVKILRRVWKKSPKGFHSDSLPQQVFQPCNLLFFFNVQSNLSKSRIILPQKQTFFFPQQNTI